MEDLPSTFNTGSHDEHVLVLRSGSEFFEKEAFKDEWASDFFNIHDVDDRRCRKDWESNEVAWVCIDPLGERGGAGCICTFAHSVGVGYCVLKKCKACSPEPFLMPGLVVLCL